MRDLAAPIDTHPECGLPMFTCQKCRRYLCTEDASGDGDDLCGVCAATDAWGPHPFDGGGTGDYRCVHCRMGSGTPRHQTEAVL